MSYRYRSKQLKRVKKQTGDDEMGGAGSKGRADAKSNISWAGKKRRQNLLRSCRSPGSRCLLKILLVLLVAAI